jgi:hypothetical protein
VRKLVIGIVVAAALCAASPAWADTQTFVVTSYNASPGVKADADIEVTVPATSAPTQKLALYLPTGGSLDLTGGLGTKVGDLQATLVQTAGGTSLDATGTITVDDPAKYTTDPVAQACAPGTHTAVWLLTLTVSGQPSLVVPLFIDATMGADVALGAYVMQACFLTSDAAPAAGGSPLAAKLTDLDLETTNVVTNPATVGVSVWRAFVTPYTPGTTTPNPSAMVELRCDLPLPHRFKALKATYSKTTRKVTITGTLLGGANPRGGVHVRILAATKPSVSALKPWAVATTDRRGHFTIVKPLPTTLYIYLYVLPYVLNSCSGTSTAPGGCVGEFVSPELGPLLTLRKRP